jgi:hypothetical protein
MVVRLYAAMTVCLAVCAVALVGHYVLGWW